MRGGGSAARPLFRTKGTPSSLHDDSQDPLHQDDPDWFFNIHPNKRCMKLIAQIERDAITDLLDEAQLYVEQ